MELTDDTFLIYAAKHYDNPQCSSHEEFEEDLKRIQYLKRLFNRYSIDRVIHDFSSNPSIFGFHPEGKRNKERDPYSFLEARFGVGQVLCEVNDAIVIPLFIYGLSNKMGSEFKRNWIGDTQKHPIHLMLGAPIDLSRFADMPNTYETHIAIAQACMDAIKQLGEEHRKQYNPQLETTEPQSPQES